MRINKTQRGKVQPITGLAVAVFNALPERYLRDIQLQEAVAMFQETHDDDDFGIICGLYDPMRYRHRWHSSYGNLFETDADFDGQMWECFLNAVAKYRRGRGNSLNPLYFQILKTTFANNIKHRQAGIRNPKVRCPICDKLISPLGSHIIQSHPELMVEALKDMGIDMDEVRACPICDDKPPVMLYDEQAKIKHFRSRHSSILFAKFLALYPDHHTAITDPAPPIGSLVKENAEGDGEGFGIDDLGVGPVFDVYGHGDSQYTRNIIRLLGDDCLSECQRIVLESIIYDGAEGPPLPDRLCKICKETRGECPRDDDFRLNRQSYREELEYLRDLIVDHIPDMV